MKARTLLTFAFLIEILLVASSRFAAAQADTTAPPQATRHSLIAFESSRDGDAEIYVMSPDGSNLTKLTDNDRYDIAPHWLADGGGIVFSAVRDEHERQVLPYIMKFDGSGEQRIELATKFMDDGFRDITYMFPSPDGSQFAFVSERNGNQEIYVVRDNGTAPVNLTNNGATDNAPAWSRDGTRIAFVSTRDGNPEVYVMNADGSNPVNLTNHDAPDFSPAWAPDGGRIVFGSRRDGNPEVYVMNADGSSPVNVSNDESEDWHPDWSPDGTQIVFYTDRDGNDEIYVMNADGSNTVNLTNHDSDDHFPSWSPWLEYPTWLAIIAPVTPCDWIAPTMKSH